MLALVGRTDGTTRFVEPVCPSSFVMVHGTALQRSGPSTLSWRYRIGTAHLGLRSPGIVRFRVTRAGTDSAV